MYPYKDPTANTIVNASFFLLPMRSPHSTGMGRAIITRSSVMLNPAPAYINAASFTHCPRTFKSQMAWIGTH